ncbi:MAG TPA: DUF1674 domain-containing protein [Alphaproteobacteria bacterium]|nr:DUF1674 domain-containing protein [Micavibrio sp.]MBK9562444.1 DUF1674 domain-containing protein [Micavibrio sp.]MBK9562676.1 DUF1674 domain-containing protein [Micavibrio sp.]HQX26796.1 DUF1674 domain-containing protein [Alphaproteobacteria bacterium]
MNREKQPPNSCKCGEPKGCCAPEVAKEINGFEALGLPEPTRYGDWDVKGRCSDF